MSIEQEYRALCSQAGMRRIAKISALELQGSDALDFLHRITTNALRNLPENSAERTIFTSEKGRIIDSTAVIHLDNCILLLGNSDHHARLIEWIQKYIVIEDITLTACLEKYAVFEILGPRAEGMVSKFCQNPISQKSVVAANIEQIDLQIINWDSNSYWLLVDNRQSDALLTELSKLLDNESELVVTDQAYQIYRITCGIAAAPNELNDTFNPHEAGIIQEVSFTKGCYIGQEVIARLDTYDKVQRHLRGIVVRQELPTESLVDRIGLYNQQQKEAGHITSFMLSPIHRHYIGLAYIRKKFEQPDAQFHIQLENHSYPVEVVSLPFTD